MADDLFTPFKMLDVAEQLINYLNLTTLKALQSLKEKKKIRRQEVVKMGLFFKV